MFHVPILISGDAYAELTKRHLKSIQIPSPRIKRRLIIFTLQSYHYCTKLDAAAKRRSAVPHLQSKTGGTSAERTNRLKIIVYTMRGTRNKRQAVPVTQGISTPVLRTYSGVQTSLSVTVCASVDPRAMSGRKVFIVNAVVMVNTPGFIR